MSNQEQDIEIQKSIDMMTTSISRVIDRMSINLEDLKEEVSDLRSQRYKPYFSSIGLFVVLILSVTGYVYNLENRITSAIFSISERIGRNETRMGVNVKLIESEAARALAREAHHIRMHEREAIREGKVVENVLELIKGNKKCEK